MSNGLDPDQDPNSASLILVETANVISRRQKLLLARALGRSE